ncbi:LacI family transcriptional regulator [Clostridia bacterium]|nr:LacI family transcriptional regulator [Clostridia bacterium]
MKTTLAQIAHETGISISTISRVVTGKGYVAPVTRMIVVEAMKRLNYEKPIRLEAQQPAADSVVLIITGGLKSSISTDTIECLTHNLERKHKTALVAVSSFSAEGEQKLLRYAAKNNCYGVIMLSVIESSETISLLQKMPCPVVFLGRYIPSLEMDFLHPDYYKMGSMAAEYLIAHGHSKIAFIGGSKTSSITQDKLMGLEDTLAAHGLALDPEMINHNDRLLYENGKNVAQWLLKLPYQPTAIFTSNDITVGIVDELLRVGVNIPRDLSIFSCDDTPMSGSCRVPLTTTCVETSRIAAETVRVLFHRKRSSSSPRSYMIFDPILIERESVTIPRKTDQFEILS